MAGRPSRKRKSVVPRKKRRGRKAKPKANNKGKKNFLTRHWRRLLLACLIGGLAYLVYLDVLIRVQFEGKRWALPARVYARPLDLYEGLAISQAQFKQELRLLGYRYAYQAIDPGTYSQQNNRLTFVTHPFNFWDGHEPSRKIELIFEQGSIQGLHELDGEEALSLFRVEPPLIGRIYPAHHEDRVLIKLEEAPDLLIQGLIAVEDRAFYSHYGVNPGAIARAVWANIKARRLVQGGSTLTQQLVKNFFLSNTRSLWRKANEAIMSLLLEWHYDKNEILEAYLNEIYLGQDNQRAIHGVGLASRFYFDRSVNQLTLPQMATLVALVRGPSYYDPHRHPKRLLTRRDLVLDIMARQNIISRASANRAKQADLTVIRERSSSLTEYPAFMDLVRRQLQREYKKEDLSSEGLQIFTTLDPHIQNIIDRALSNRIQQLDRQRELSGKLQGAVVVTSTTGSEVLALTSDRRPRYAGFNRALDAVRPIGSLIKPAVYLTALRRADRYTLVTSLEDKPISLRAQNGEIWSPRNYDGRSHGVVPMYQALVKSYNQATVRLGFELGFEAIADTLQRLGAERDIPPYPSTLLGASAFTPYEVAKIYQTIAANGFRSPLRIIREVMTVDGEPLRRFPLKVEQTVDVRSVQVLNSALQEVVRQGTARALRARLPQGLRVAGKTGTTNDLKDSWFAGFSGRHLAVVWLGADDNQSTGLTGATGALQVWGDIFSQIKTLPLDNISTDEVKYYWIDAESGLLSAQGCKSAVYLAFVKGTAPKEYTECAADEARDGLDNAVDWFKGWFN